MKNSLEEAYYYAEHTHNYAVWTAARASQRGFTTTKNIKTAIEKTQLKALLEGDLVIRNIEDFDAFHKRCCELIMNEIKEMGIESVTYGRAAKIVNIYIKTAIVIPNVHSDLAHIVHPPIDRILLANLRQKKKIEFNSISWTQFTEREYLSVIEKLRSNGFGKSAPFWKVEAYWSPVDEK